MRSSSGFVRRIVASAAGVACALALLGGTLAQSSAGLPASIIAGNCASPGAVAAPLANLSASAPGVSTPAAAGLAPAGAAVIPVQTSVTTLAMKLTDLVDGGHAISVSLGGAQTVAACGNLGAQPNSGDVVVGLAGASGSRYSGIAWLHSVGDQTQVTVFVTQSSSGSGEGEGQGGGSNSDAG